MIEGLPLEEKDKEKLRGEARDTIGLGFVRGLAQKDPYAARALIQSGQLNDIVGKDKLPSLNERIDGEIRGAEAETRRQEAEVRRQQADARREKREEERQIGDRVEDTLGYLAQGGQIAPNELRATIAAAAGIGRPELARRATQLGVQSLVTTKFASAAPSELQDHITI